MPTILSPAFVDEAQGPERQIIGSLLLDFDKAWKFAGSIPAEAFSDELCRNAFSAMRALEAEGEMVDLMTVGMRLGGNAPTQLSYMQEAAISSANIEQYVRLLLDQHNRLRLAASLREALAKLRHPRNRTLDVIHGLESVISRLHQLSRYTSGVGEILQSRLLEVRSRKPYAGTSGLASGYIEIDNLLDGFRPGDMIVLAARPSHGKTSLALNMCRRIVGRGAKAAIFSLEMTTPSLITRVLSGDSHVNYSRLRSRRPLTPEEIERTSRAAEILADLPLYVYDQSTLGDVSLDAVMNAVRTRHAENKFDLIVIDHAQAVAYPKEKRFDARIFANEISGEVKRLSRKLGVPIIIVSQLSRDPEKRGRKRPKLSDLKETGNWEQDADIVLLLYRPEMYAEELKSQTFKVKGKATPIAGLALVDIAKNRDGEIGLAALTWQGQFQRFENYCDPELDMESPDEEEQEEYPF